MRPALEEGMAQETSAEEIVRIPAAVRVVTARTEPAQGALEPVTEAQDHPIVRTVRETVTAEEAREEPDSAADVPGRGHRPLRALGREDEEQQAAAALAVRTVRLRRISEARTSAAIPTVLPETATTRRTLRSSRTSSARERTAPAALSSQSWRRWKSRKSRSR